MALVVLVSGSPDRVGEVADALETAGCRAIRVDDVDKLQETCADLGPESVGAYVQLPVQVSGGGSTAVARIRGFLSQGLLARYDAVEAVLPTLQPGATVALISGHLPSDLSAPDDQRARLALLRVLAHAVLADTSGRNVRTVVIDHRRPPAEISRAVVEAPPDQLRMIAEIVESYPDMNYDDWKFELLRLASTET